MLLAQFPSMHDFPRFFPRLACFSKASRQLTSTSRTCPTLDQVPGKTNWETPNWRPHIFQRGGLTTNQSLFDNIMDFDSLGFAVMSTPDFSKHWLIRGPLGQTPKNLGVIMLRDGLCTKPMTQTKGYEFLQLTFLQFHSLKFVFQFQVSISRNFPLLFLWSDLLSKTAHELNSVSCGRIREITIFWW